MRTGAGADAWERSRTADLRQRRMHVENTACSAITRGAPRREKPLTNVGKTRKNFSKSMDDEYAAAARPRGGRQARRIL